MRFLTKSWPGAASAALLLLAFPPFNLWFLVFLALSPWLISLQGTTGRQAWRSGYGFGLLFSLAQLYWMFSLTYKWTGSAGLALVPWLLASTLMAVYFGLTGTAISACFRKEIPWAIPLVWAGVEVFRSYIPVFAFPWALLATPLAAAPALIQPAHWGAIYLVSAWGVIPSLAFALYLLRRKVGDVSGKQVKALTSAFGLLFFASLAIYAGKPTGTRHVVTVGQTGYDMAFGRDPTGEAIHIGNAVNRFEATAAADGTELLVLPEGIAHGGRRMPPEAPFELDRRVPTLFGGQRGDKPAYQTAFAFDGRWQYVDKTRLVIFGEFVPGRDWIPFLDQFDLPSGDLQAGQDGVRSLKIGKLEVGPVLCFEALFPDIAYRHAHNGAQLLAVMSIDDWFMGTTAPAQLRMASIWRAVETGLPLVRAASLGHTLAVDAHGNVIAELPVGATQAARVELDLPDGAQPLPTLPVFPVLALLSVPGVFIVRRQRSKES